MPGDNCSVFGYGTRRRTKGVGTDGSYRGQKTKTTRNGGKICSGKFTKTREINRDLKNYGDGGNYVTFHKLNVRLIKDKKNNSSSQRELRPSVFQCDRFAQICLLLARPSF